jgi:hypothetical protein
LLFIGVFLDELQHFEPKRVHVVLLLKNIFVFAENELALREEESEFRDDDWLRLARIVFSRFCEHRNAFIHYAFNERDSLFESV